MVRSIILILTFFVSLSLSAQKISWITNDNKVRVDLIDSMGNDLGKHYYHFKITNNSDRILYFVTDGDSMLCDYSTSYTDSSGFSLGVGVVRITHHRDHSDIFSVIPLKEGSTIESRVFNCTYSEVCYDLVIHFDFLYEKVKIRGLNLISASDYLEKCEKFDLQLSLNDCNDKR